MGVLGLWRGVLRGILGWSRGANGRFYREIPGFSGGVRARHGDSAHGGHCRARGAKKFLKIFKKRGENPKNGVPEVPGGGVRASYIGCAR